MSTTANIASNIYWDHQRHLPGMEVKRTTPSNHRGEPFYLVFDNNKFKRGNKIKSPDTSTILKVLDNGSVFEGNYRYSVRTTGSKTFPFLPFRELEVGKTYTLIE